MAVAPPTPSVRLAIPPRRSPRRTITFTPGYDQPSDQPSNQPSEQVWQSSPHQLRNLVASSPLDPSPRPQRRGYRGPTSLEVSLAVAPRCSRRCLTQPLRTSLSGTVLSGEVTARMTMRPHPPSPTPPNPPPLGPPPLPLSAA